MAYDGFVESDYTLIKRAQQKDTRAFQILVERYIHAVLRFVTSLVQNREDAEDIVQDTFFSVWKHLSSFDTTRSFKPWLFTIAKNQAFNWLSKKKPTLFSEFISYGDDTNIIIDTLTEEVVPPSIQFDNALNKERIQRALHTLSPIQQIVITLHYMEELTFEEIASIFNESVHTVKSRSRRALIHLKKLLSE